MKKSFLIIVFAFIATILFSCKKSSQLVSDPHDPLPALAPVTTIASEWLSMPLTIVKNSDGSSFLQASEAIDNVSQADLSSHHVLVYSRNPGRDSWVYNQLPMNITTDEGNVEVSYILDATNFSVKMTNADSYQPINIQRFENFQFRFVLVAATDYETMPVDWSNYETVATALHL